MPAPIIFRRFVAALLLSAAPAAAQNTVTFVFTADVHYGITRPAFRGDSNVAAGKVNAALVRALNTLPGTDLPDDGGVESGQRVKAIDFVVVGGDVANRAEKGVQTAAASWAEFQRDYVHALKLRATDGSPARLFVVPGNHDVSNAVGFPKPLDPARDATSLAGIFAMMTGRTIPPREFDPRRYVLHTSRSIGGVHFVFLSIWPDSAQRAWMTRDLDTVARATPVVIVTHDPPIADPKHFTNPRGDHDVNATDRFENVIMETYKDAASLDEGRGAGGSKASTDVEQREFAAFLLGHPNVKAYFHGHTNANEFYVWHGPDNNVALETFRVDSPMKGGVSSRDERKLSFHLVTINVTTGRMTVRECLWNAQPDGRLTFGQSKSVFLR